MVWRVVPQRRSEDIRWEIFDIILFLLISVCVRSDCFEDKENFCVCLVPPVVSAVKIGESREVDRWKRFVDIHEIVFLFQENIFILSKAPRSSSLCPFDVLPKRSLREKVIGGERNQETEKKQNKKVSPAFLSLSSLCGCPNGPRLGFSSLGISNTRKCDAIGRSEVRFPGQTEKRRTGIFSYW